MTYQISSAIILHHTDYGEADRIEHSQQRAHSELTTHEAGDQAVDRTDAADDIVRPMLSNPFTALAASPPNALGIIIFALLLGIACTVVGAKRAGPVISFFLGMNAVMMKITVWLMAF